MALLLAGVVRLLYRAGLGTLDRQFGAIDNQRLGFRSADARFPANADQGLRQLFHAFDRTADRALVHVVQKSQELLCHVTAVVDQHDEQVILQAAHVRRST